MPKQELEEILTALSAIDFEEDIRRLSEGFKGRDWVLRKIDSWLGNAKAEQIFLVTGEPGSGKSAFAAHLIQSRQLAAYHFCIAGRGSTSNPNSALRSLASRLSDSLPGYDLALANTILPEHLKINVNLQVQRQTGGQITGVAIHKLYAANPLDTFDILFRAPLASMPTPPHPLVLLIDSLDEAYAYSKPPNLVTLFANANDLPDWVRFIFTTRPEERILSYLTHYEACPLDEDSPENRKDLKEFVHTGIKKPAIQKRLKQAGKGTADLLNALRLDTREVNFLFYKALLSDIASGTQPLDNMDSLPRSLDEIYHGFLMRFDPEDWRTRFQPIFKLLAVARDPLTEKQLSHFSGILLDQVRQDLGVALQFLDKFSVTGHPDTYLLYHQSMRDYLTNPDRSRLFFCDPLSAHQRIAEFYTPYLENQDWDKCDSYGLRHLPAHLLGMENYGDSARLLNDLIFIRARFATDMLSELFQDYAAAQAAGEHLSSGQQESLRAFAQFVGSQVHILREQPGLIFQQALNQPDESPIRRAAKTLFEKGKVPVTWFRWINKSQTRDPLLVTIQGTQARPVSCSWTPDRGELVTIFEDGLVLFWDSRDYKETHRVALEHGPIRSAAWTTNGSCLVTSHSSGWIPDRDAYLEVWDMSTKKPITLFHDHRDTINACAFSPDGKTVASASDDGNVYTWDARKGIKLRKLRVGESEATCVAWSPDGKRVVVGYSGYTLKIFDANTGEMLKELGRSETIEETWGSHYETFFGHSSSVNTCAWSPDGKRIVSGSGRLNQGQEKDDFSLRVWDAETGEELAVLSGHNDQVTACDWSTDGSLIVSSSGSVVSPAQDNSLRVWDAYSYQELAVFRGHSNEVRSVAWAPDGSKLLSVSLDGTIKVWSVEKTELSADALDILPEITHFAWSHDRKLAAAIALNNRIILLDVENGKLERTLPGHPEKVTNCAWAPEDSRLASVGEDRALRIWDVEKGRELAVFHGDEDEITYTAGGHRIVWGALTDCAWAPDGKLIATTTYQGGLLVWDTATGQRLYSLYEHTAPASICTWSPDGRMIATGSRDFEHLRDNRVLLWKIDDLETYYSLDTEASWVGDLKWSTTGKRLLVAAGLVAADDHKLLICDFTEDQFHIFDELSSGPGGVDWSLDETRIACSNQQNEVLILDVKTGEIVRTLPGHAEDFREPEGWRKYLTEYAVKSCSWSPDGEYLLTAASSGRVKLWRVDTGEKIAEFFTSGKVLSAQIGERGRRVLVLDDLGKLYILELVLNSY